MIKYEEITAQASLALKRNLKPVGCLLVSLISEAQAG
jgi:hypothetical protein